MLLNTYNQFCLKPLSIFYKCFYFKETEAHKRVGMNGNSFLHYGGL